MFFLLCSIINLSIALISSELKRDKPCLTSGAENIFWRFNLFDIFYPPPHLYFEYLNFYLNPTLITLIIYSISYPAYPSFYIKIKNPNNKINSGFWLNKSNCVKLRQTTIPISFLYQEFNLLFEKLLVLTVSFLF